MLGVKLSPTLQLHGIFFILGHHDLQRLTTIGTLFPGLKLDLSKAQCAELSMG